MKKFSYLLLTLALPGLILTGCKYDDDDLWSKVNDHEERLAALEQWQTTMNGNITALQSLITALQDNDYVTGVTLFDMPAPGGYKITFSKSGEATIWNGAKGDKGDTGANGEKGDSGYSPLIGVNPDTDGKYYWALDGEWLLDGSDNKVPVTGEKGDAGDTGTPGQNGATPKVIIGSDSYWYVSANGSATGTPPGGSGWTPTGVKATGDKGDTGDTGATGSTGAKGDRGDAIFAANGIDLSDPDNVTFTLANGTDQITLPKYKAVGISFDQPLSFSAGTAQTITYATNPGTADPTIIRVVDLPAGWKCSVNTAGKTITVTPPSSFTADNFMGEATVLVGVDNLVAAMYALTVTGEFTGPATNQVGAIYYEKGVATGIVYIINDGTVGTGRVVNINAGPAMVWGPGDVETGAKNYNDGLANMSTIKTLDNDFSNYPPFAWCDRKNGVAGATNYASGQTGIWYLPSASELQALRCVWNGGIGGAEINGMRSIFNGWLTAAGGDEYSTGHTWSSTEERDIADYACFSWGIVYANFAEDKTNEKVCRAVLVF